MIYSYFFRSIHQFWRVVACTAFAFVFLLPNAAAHEFWLLPDRFQGKPGEQVNVQVLVGSGWPGEPLPRNPYHAQRFDWVDATGQSVMQGETGDEPAGFAVPSKPGAAWAVYRSNPTSITLPAAQFEGYLRDEGLLSVLKARQAQGASNSPGREVYSRCAKALVDVGSHRSSAAMVSHRVGLALELVPLSDPRHAKKGRATPFLVLWQGKPLPDVLVKGLPQSTDTQPEQVRTDARGIARLKLNGTGVWLVNTVHMLPAQAGGEVDWESTWSSLVFEKAP